MKNVKKGLLKKNVLEKIYEESRGLVLIKKAGPASLQSLLSVLFADTVRTQRSSTCQLIYPAIRQELWNWSRAEMNSLALRK